MSEAGRQQKSLKMCRFAGESVFVVLLVSLLLLLFKQLLAIALMRKGCLHLERYLEMYNSPTQKSESA
eukprot:3452531-Amphidinium_carterae.1